METDSRNMEDVNNIMLNYNSNKRYKENEEQVYLQFVYLKAIDE